MTKGLNENDLFEIPGARVTVGPLIKVFKPVVFFDKIIRLEIADPVYERIREAQPVRSAPERTGGYNEFRGRKEPTLLSHVEQVLGRNRGSKLWMVGDIIHKQLTTRDEGSLVESGRKNLFWAPEPLIVFEDEPADLWRMRDAEPNESFRKFDRVFFFSEPVL
jgi:hypothetical protein